MKTTPLTRKTPLKARKPMARTSRPRMTAARKAASGQPCMVRIPGVCNFDPATTVLAHYRMAGGAGIKPHDDQGAWACSACHDAVDRRSKTQYSRNELRLFHAEGVFRTQEAIRREAA